MEKTDRIDELDSKGWLNLSKEEMEERKNLDGISKFLSEVATPLANKMLNENSKHNQSKYDEPDSRAQILQYHNWRTKEQEMIKKVDTWSKAQ